MSNLAQLPQANDPQAALIDTIRQQACEAAGCGSFRELAMDLAMNAALKQLGKRLQAKQAAGVFKAAARRRQSPKLRLVAG